MKNITPMQRLEKIEKILRDADFSGFVHPAVVLAHKIAKEGLKKTLK